MPIPDWRTIDVLKGSRRMPARRPRGASVARIEAETQFGFSTAQPGRKRPVAATGKLLSDNNLRENVVID
jgi:hypothetical protein